MDELNDITDEERALANELARELASPSRSTASDPHEKSGELASLRAHATLLRASPSWEPSAEVLARVRTDLQSRTVKRPTRTWARLRWYFWLPLPAALAFFFSVSNKSLEPVDPNEPARASAPASAEWKASDDEEFKPLPPRYHLGQTPASLLKAQAKVLQHREVGAERNEARASLEREMRRYRGTLLAGLELGGR